MNAQFQRVGMLCQCTVERRHDSLHYFREAAREMRNAEAGPGMELN
jgi:hypothetical protein